MSLIISWDKQASRLSGLFTYLLPTLLLCGRWKLENNTVLLMLEQNNLKM